MELSVLTSVPQPVRSCTIPPPGPSPYTTGSLNTARYYHTATLLNNGMVLMAGGWGLQRYLSQCGAVQSRHRDLHLYRQPEHRARHSHGDAAEQRHGADGGRLWLQRRLSQCGAVRTGHADAAEPRLHLARSEQPHGSSGHRAALHRLPARSAAAARNSLPRSPGVPPTPRSSASAMMPAILGRPMPRRQARRR